MTSRTALIRAFTISAMFAGLLLVGLATSKEARAGWWGCGGFECTSVVESCTQKAAEWGEIFLYYTSTGYNTATCHTTPRLGGYTTFGTVLYCAADELYNPGRAGGCQKWEEPDTFGPCPTCGVPSPTPTGPGSPGGPVGGSGGASTPNPITLSNGNKVLVVTDYRSSGADALEFTRYYNSLSWTTPNMGYGWRHNFSANVYLESATTIRLRRNDGRIERFISANGNNPWVAEKGGIVGRLAKTATGWTYTHPNDTVESFDSTGSLLSITRKNGYTQTIDKAVGGVPGNWAVTDSHGRTLKLIHTYHGGYVGWRLRRVVDPEGRVYTYEYKGLDSYNSELWVLNKVIYPDDDDLPMEIVDAPLGVNDVLLTHLDGLDGATTATDESPGAHPLTFVGGAKISTAQSHQGGASAYINNSASSYIVTPDSEDWNFGGGQFTVETWVQFASTADWSNLVMQYDVVSPIDQISWLLAWNAGEARFAYSPNGSSASTIVLTGSWTPVVGAWYHIAVDRDVNNRLRVYIDGQPVIDQTVSAVFHNSTDVVRIGRGHNGWLDDVRITKGEARYGAAWNTRDNNPFVTYQYEDPRFPYALTGVTDETGQRTTTWSYNDEGRGLSSEHAGGVDSVALTYNADGTKTVTNPLGKQFKYSFSTIGLLPRITRIDRLASADSPAAAMTFAYDANSYVNQTTDFNGNITKYVHDSRGLQTSRTEGFGTPEERTTTTVWDPVFRVPAQIVAPERTTDMTYYADGLLYTRTVTDTTSHVVPYSTAGQTRTTTYTYNAQGLVETVDGPLPGAGDTTTYAYDAVTGNLTSVTNALGHVTQITAYDASGRPLTTLDANNVETTLVYDPRGRLKTRTVDSGAGGTPAVTEFGYDAAGQMISTIQPDGSVMTYEYDAADRLSAIQNGVGERIEYSYDAMGNRTSQVVKDSSLTIVRQSTALFDDLGRMLKSLGAYVGEDTVFAYDANGNTVSVTDPLANVTGSGFDALNRLIAVTDALTNTATYTYDAAGNRETATDQRGLVTSYVHNGFGEVIQQSSPDTGATVFTYDTAGRRTSRTDARGVVTNWTYDDLGRTLTMSFPASPAENVTYTYDDPTLGLFGIGRMAAVADDSGSTSYRYDARGNMVRVDTVVGAQAYVTQYAYDLADRMVQMTYPSGRIVDYGRDAIGRVNLVTTRANELAPPVTLASGLTYEPFGGLDAMAYGNGVTLALAYDLDGRMTAMDAFNGATAILDLDYGFDLAGNIRTITDAGLTGRDRGYVYDTLHRLTDASGGIPAESYGYDAVGNRTAATVGAVGETYAYDAFSNRLDGVTAGGVTRTLGYSDSGNTASDDNGAGTVLTNIYDSTDRLTEVRNGAATVATYLHNAAGQRVAKTVGGVTTHYLYDLGGNLIGEADGGAGGSQADYVWLAGMPLAFVQGGAVYFVHADHLGTPQRLTDAAAAVAWDATYRPFGEATVSGAVTFNPRFPPPAQGASEGGRPVLRRRDRPALQLLPRLRPDDRPLHPERPDRAARRVEYLWVCGREPGDAGGSKGAFSNSDLAARNQLKMSGE